MNDLINKQIDIFCDYVLNNFDINRPLVKLKYEHTLYVVMIMTKICEELGLNYEDSLMGVRLALFHDLGRFYEEKLLNGTFDDVGFDHAEASNMVLFNEGLIKEFGVKEKDYDIIKKAVYNHNKVVIESGLSPREEFFAKLIRDADKIDIYRAVMRSEAIQKPVFNTMPNRLNLSNYFEGKPVYLKNGKTDADYIICRIGWYDQLYFDESRRVLEITGNLENYIKTIEVPFEYKELFDSIIAHYKLAKKNTDEYLNNKKK